MKRLLNLSLLGSFQIKLADQPVTKFEYDKVRALLAYLVVEINDAHRRDTLTGLLWPEQPEQAARHSLSQALLTLRQALGDKHNTPPFILADRTTVQFNPSSAYWLDVAEFEALLADLTGSAAERLARQQQAVALYRGDFLKGISIGDSPAFEEWLVLKRERLHHLALEALFALAQHHEWRGELRQAQHYARRQVALEPWREEAQRQLMRLLAHSGQRSAALAQYQSCQRVLAEELGVEPSAETTALYRRIRNSAAVPPHHLPAQPTPFVGREEELAEIQRMLAHPQCRVLTIVGSGGIGKTRLALQVAQKILPQFLDGVYFMPLARLDAAGLMITTIANTLGFALDSDDEAQQQLLDYLNHKEMLLILDNFEHLLGAAIFITEILKQTQRLKFLITSRQRLNLQWEQRFELRGLLVPALDEVTTRVNLENYSASQLFLQCVRRVRRDFAPVSADEAAVARICRLVEGMPLAIELAAAWVRAASCREIAGEIERNLDVLASTAPDIIHRHRSLRAVFDHSWQLLSAPERDAFEKLSVFRAGFSLAAARQVAGVSLSTLAALVDKSLLRYQASGRYDMHELLRHYAAEKLAQNPPQKENVLNQHSAYYVRFLEERVEVLRSRDQDKALSEIDQEIENARLAWRRLTSQTNTEQLDRCLEGLFLFYDLRSWFHEGKAAFRAAGEQLERTAKSADSAFILARLRAREGRFCSQLSEYEAAKDCLQKSLVVFRQVEAQAEIAFTLNILGEVELRRGVYEAALEPLVTSLFIYRAIKDQKGTAICLNNLGIAKQNLGQYGAARQCCEESLSISRAIGDRWEAAASLHTLGHMAYEQGAYQEALQAYQESLAIKRGLQDRRGISSVLNTLGLVHYALGEYNEAERYIEESLALRRELGNRWGVASSVLNLGMIALGRKDYDLARRWYQESLMIYRTVGNQRGIAKALTNLGEIAFLTGAHREAIENYEESLKIFQDIGHTIGMTHVFSYLGDVYVALEVYQEAEVHYHNALRLALKIQSAARALDTLTGVAALLLKKEAYDKAAALLTFILNQPASEQATLEKAQHLLDDLMSVLSAETLTFDSKDTPINDWQAVVQSLLID